MRPPAMLTAIFFVISTPFALHGEPVMHQLSAAPERLELFKEIAVVYDPQLPPAFNALKPEERTLVYFLFRAGLPGNRVCTDQMHKEGLAVQHIFQTIFNSKTQLLALSQCKHPLLANLDVPQFIREVETYLVYLWSNHGQYFQREHADEKRTPGRLGLALLTKDYLCAVLSALGNEALSAQVSALEKVIFDHTYQPTGTVANSIELSARNFYAPGFTESDYRTLGLEERAGLNTYCTLEITRDGARVAAVEPYAATGKYGPELSVAVHWLQKAHQHALRYPTIFDQHLAKSLELLIRFLQTGDEELFKQHSIAWLKSKSNVDYCFGFIETYDDPKNQRGSFQAEATIRSITLDQLSAILPNIEQQLPVDAEYMRDFSGKDLSLPNASINTKIFGAGHLGPMKVTAAYCLPNYEEIRATYGSKQVIYPSGKSLGSLINPLLSRKLFYSRANVVWLEQNDPERALSNDLWDAQCILHETLGHGSGKLAKHTFTQEELTLWPDAARQPGDTIAVTSDNLADLLHGYDAAIEELRAEVIALYVSVFHLPALAEHGLLTRWYTQLGHDELQRWLMFHMLNTGLTRLLQQPDSATEITGDHARANATITNVIIAAGGARIVEERFDFEGSKYTVVALEVTDIAKAMAATSKLLTDVQRIKSTGDGFAAKQLIETYGVKINNMQQFKQLRENNKIVLGDLKAKVDIYPHLEPVLDATGNVYDVTATWPSTIFEQWETYQRLALSTDF